MALIALLVTERFNVTRPRTMNGLGDPYYSTCEQ